MDAVTFRAEQAFSKVIRGLLLPAPTAVVFRMQPIALDGDKTPLAIVSIGGTEEFEPLCTVSRRDYLLWSVKRPVSVYFAFAGGGGVADDPDMRSWRDAIWGLNADMLQRTGLLPEVNNVEPRGNAIFDAPAFRNTTVDWGGVVLTLETLEERPR